MNIFKGNSVCVGTQKEKQSSLTDTNSSILHYGTWVTLHQGKGSELTCFESPSTYIKVSHVGSKTGLKGTLSLLFKKNLKKLVAQLTKVVSTQVEPM